MVPEDSLLRLSCYHAAVTFQRHSSPTPSTPAEGGLVAGLSRRPLAPESGRSPQPQGPLGLPLPSFPSQAAPVLAPRGFSAHSS